MSLNLLRTTDLASLLVELLVDVQMIRRAICLDCKVNDFTVARISIIFDLCSEFRLYEMLQPGSRSKWTSILQALGSVLWEVLKDTEFLFDCFRQNYLHHLVF